MLAPSRSCLAASCLATSWLALAACSAGGGEGADEPEAAKTTAAPAPAVAQKAENAAQKAENAPQPGEPAPGDVRLRVLVTGFNDWRELGDPPNVWRCRDNPSCRLLLGAEANSEPSEYSGPLAERLRAAAPKLDWRFATMPVTWGAFASVPEDVDVIINVGLGVYDRFDALQLEVGAYNHSDGQDAAGTARSSAIQADAGEILAAPGPIAAKIEALAGQTLAGYEILAAAARPENSYLCNETHYHALSTLREGSGRLREVYFLHIPYAKDGDYESLADGVAGVILGLAPQA